MDGTALPRKFASVLAQRSDDGGATIVGMDGDDVVVVQARGRWLPPHADTISGGLGRAIERTDIPPVVFWDLAALEHYEGRLRRQVTQWLVDNYQRLGRHHYLVTNSSLVAMGAATAGLALAVVGVRVHVTRSAEQFVRWYESPATRPGA